MSKRKAIVVEGLDDIQETLAGMSRSIDDCQPNNYGIESKLDSLQESVSNLEDAMRGISCAVYAVVEELQKSREQTEKWKKAKLISK